MAKTNTVLQTVNLKATERQYETLKSIKVDIEQTQIVVEMMKLVVKEEMPKIQERTSAPDANLEEAANKVCSVHEEEASAP